MMPKTVQVRLFSSSFAPLLVTLAIRLDDPRIRLALLAAAAAAFVIAVSVLGEYSRLAPHPRTIASAADKGSDAIAYVTALLLPFLLAGDADRSDVLAYVLFAALVGLLYGRSDALAVNPVLYILGMRTWAVGFTDSSYGMLIAAGRPQVGGVVRCVQIGDGIWLDGGSADD